MAGGTKRTGKSLPTNGMASVSGAPSVRATPARTQARTPARSTAAQAPADPNGHADHLGDGCGVPDDHVEGRKAVGVDGAAKERNLKRLRRIEGQVRGLQRMVDEDRYCADIMTQISSVHEALRAVGRELMRNHLKHCATAAVRGTSEDAEAMYDELVEMMYRHSR